MPVTNSAPSESKPNKLKIVVLISGNGSNLQILIDQMNDCSLPIEIVAVISNKTDAFGLKRADQANIKTYCIDNKNFVDRRSYDIKLQQIIDEINPQLIVLAGFMRILTKEFVDHFEGRLINVHPSLLPNYRGLNTHQRALDDKVEKHGVSVHFVTPELDSGAVIAQSELAINPQETAQTLALRVQKKEHLLYPLVISWIALGRLTIINNELIFDKQPLKKPVIC